MDEINNVPQNEETQETPVTPAYEAEPTAETAAPAAESVVVAEQEAPQKKFDGLGLAAMICSIASVVICYCYGIGIIPAIVGLILGCVAKADPATGKKSALAKVGIIVGAISIGLNLIWMIVMIAGIGQFMTEYDSLYYDLY